MLPQRRSTLTFLRQQPSDSGGVFPAQAIKRTFEDSEGVKFTKRRDPFSGHPAQAAEPSPPPPSAAARCRSRSRRRLSFGPERTANDENDASAAQRFDADRGGRSGGGTLKFGSDSSAAFSAGARSRKPPAVSASARKPRTPSYRQTRRLVKRNTIGAPSRSSTHRVLFGDSSAPADSNSNTNDNYGRGDAAAAAVCDTPPPGVPLRRPSGRGARGVAAQGLVDGDSALQPALRPQQRQQRRGSGSFMVDVSKRKVIDASSPAKLAEAFAPGHLTSDTFSELESRALASVKKMLHLRYSGGDVPQDHPLFQLERIDPAGWDTAMRQFNAIERTQHGLAQVVILQNCIRAISARSSELYGGAAAGADMLLPALIYVLVNSNVPDLVGLYRRLRSERPSAVAKFYNESQLAPALARMDLTTLRAAWAQVQSDVGNSSSPDGGDDDDNDDDDEFDIQEEDLTPSLSSQSPSSSSSKRVGAGEGTGGVLVLGDEKAIRRRMSLVSPNVCRNDIIMRIMDVVRETPGGGRRRGRRQELYQSLQNNGVLMSCGQICYVVTLLESALRFLVTPGLTMVLRHESELESNEKKYTTTTSSNDHHAATAAATTTRAMGNKGNNPDLILCTRAGVGDAELVLRHCLLKSQALQCFYHPDGPRQALLRFYHQHNPGKAGNIDHILKLYRGRERQMFTKLHQKYQAVFFKGLPAGGAPPKNAARSVRKATLRRSVTRG